MNLNELRDRAYKTACNHGFHDEELSNEHCLCLVISELMEAVEADRNNKYADRKSFKDYYEDLLKSPVFFFVTLINFFGNLAMFIPIGFFSALLFRNATLKRSAIIGFGMSTFIEFAQYFIMRNTAVDDIILNTLGAICGYWVYRLLRKMFPGFSRKFICNITQAAGN